jgi:hypothetical protein
MHYNRLKLIIYKKNGRKKMDEIKEFWNDRYYETLCGDIVDIYNDKYRYL